MIDQLDDLKVERTVLGQRNIWTTSYRDAEVTVVAEHDPVRGAIWHRIFIRELGARAAILGTEPAPAVYKTMDAAGEAGLRRAMAYLDRSPLDVRTSAEF